MFLVNRTFAARLPDKGARALCRQAEDAQRRRFFQFVYSVKLSNNFPVPFIGKFHVLVSSDSRTGNCAMCICIVLKCLKVFDLQVYMILLQTSMIFYAPSDASCLSHA